MDVLCACLLDFLVKALLVPPQVSDLAESLPAILADVFLHVRMNRIRMCLRSFLLLRSYIRRYISNLYPFAKISETA